MSFRPSAPCQRLQAASDHAPPGPFPRAWSPGALPFPSPAAGVECGERAVCAVAGPTLPLCPGLNKASRSLFLAPYVPFVNKVLASAWRESPPIPEPEAESPPGASGAGRLGGWGPRGPRLTWGGGRSEPGASRAATFRRRGRGVRLSLAAAAECGRLNGLGLRVGQKAPEGRELTKGEDTQAAVGVRAHVGRRRASSTLILQVLASGPMRTAGPESVGRCGASRRTFPSSPPWALRGTC